MTSQIFTSTLPLLDSDEGRVLTSLTGEGEAVPGSIVFESAKGGIVDGRENELTAVGEVGMIAALNTAEEVRARNVAGCAAETGHMSSQEEDGQIEVSFLHIELFIKEGCEIQYIYKE